MDASDLIGFGFLILIVLGGLAKRAFESGPRGPARPRPEKGPFEASPDDVTEFLRRLDEQRRAPGPQQPPVPAPEPVVGEGPQGPSLESILLAGPRAGPSGEGPVDEGPRRPSVQSMLSGERGRVPAGEGPVDEGPQGPALESVLSGRRPEQPAAQPSVVRERRRGARRRPAPAAQPPQAATPEAARTVAGIGLPAAGKHGLRDAVIWSEILGRPLSMRRGRRQMPPSMGR